MARIKYYDPKTNEWTYADSNTIVNLTGYATEIWVQDNYQEKGNYLTEHQDISGKLDADRLPEAISTALAQAKESGVFDGPKGDDYVLTPADKEEIAEIASDLVDISKSNEIYILGAGEDIEDAPASAIMVINPNGDVNMPSTGGNVAYDEAQNLTEEQKAQARENIGAQPAGNYLTKVPEGYAKTEDIPTDEHINSLINTALGVIENGTY